MQYRRKESFRFTFDTPQAAVVQLQVNDSNRLSYSCDLIDISSRGARLFSPIRLDEYTDDVIVQLVVTLFKKELVIPGEIVWKRPSKDGTLFGMHFSHDQKQEQDIISELKFRRHKELEEEFRLKGKRLH